MILMKVKKLHPDAVLPTYATPGAACFDLYAVEDGYVDTIAHTSEIIPTGLAFEIPPGWVMKVYSRSGHAFKNNVRLANCVAIIDSDFRGEIMIKLAADDDAALSIKAGDRVAQAMLERVEPVEFVEVDELGDTARGTGGFGSTGQ